MSKNHRQVVPTLNAQQQAMFDMCMARGLLAVYEGAMREVNPQRFPKCVEISLKQYIACMGRSRDAKREFVMKCRAELGCRVDFYVNHGILLVVNYDTEEPLTFVVNPANKRRDLRIDRTPVRRPQATPAFDSATSTQDPRHYRGARGR